MLAQKIRLVHYSVILSYIRLSVFCFLASGLQKPLNGEQGEGLVCTVCNRDIKGDLLLDKYPPIMVINDTKLGILENV